MAQPGAIAFGTKLVVEILGELFTHHHRISLAIAPFEIRNDSFEGVLTHHGLAALGEILECDLLLFAAVQDNLLDALRQLLERLFQIEAIMAREALQHLTVELVAAVPASDRARRER